MPVAVCTVTVVRRCVASGALCIALVALLGHPGTALADSARPSANPAGVSPTAPDPTGPPVGQAPDGSTVGGSELASRGLLLPTDYPPLPADITARGWVVADATTGRILGANDPHGRYYPASTLKLLTMLSLHPLLDPATVVTATLEDEQMEGSRVGMIVGGQYDVATLWLALMLQSGNDAANALSRTAGGLEQTLEAMYETADHLGALDTSPGGPSGLDVDGQRSSAYDLALLMTAAVADPDLLAVMGTERAQIPGVPNRDPGFEIQNQNQLLLNYPGALAGKTGFTDAARYTFVGAAERGGRRLVVSLMQAEQVPIPTWEQAARLLDWGFTFPADAAGVGALVAPGTVDAGSPAAESGEAEPADIAVESGAGDGQAPVLAEGDDADSDVSGILPLLALLAGTAAIVAATAIGVRRARLPTTTPPGRRHRPGGSAGVVRPLLPLQNPQSTRRVRKD